MIILSAIAFRASGKRMIFNIKQMEDKRIFQTFNMKDKDADKESCTFEHVALLIQIPRLMGDLLANPAHQAVLSNSQECLEMHLLFIISGQLVQGTGEFSGSVWCFVLARSQDAGCRLKGCAETELINPAGHELSLCRQTAQ